MKDKQAVELEKCAAIAGTNFRRVEECILNNRHMEAAAMRSALESALKVYWIYRWDCYDPTESLFNRIKFLSDKGEFNIVIINHMHMIRTLGNQQLHEGESLDLKTANDLFDVFKKCIQAIGEKVGIDLMQKDVVESESNIRNIGTGETKVYTKEKFWSEFQKVLTENGGEYSLHFVNGDIAMVKYHTSPTNLFIVVEDLAEKAFLFEKSDMQETCLVSNDFAALDLESLLLEIDKKCKGKSILQAGQTNANGKILYKFGQIWEGESYVDLINRIFHKKYKRFMRSTLTLQQFDAPGIAWIVVMNGLPHGANGDLWINRLFEKGEVIEEEYVGINKNKTRQEFLQRKEVLFSDRLAFQKDPDNVGNNFKAKCLGYYILQSYDADKLVRVWKRKSESLVLNIH